MGKRMVLCLSLMLTAVLAACGGNESPTSSSEEATSSRQEVRENESFIVTDSEFQLETMILRNIEYRRLAPGELPDSPGETVLLLGDFINRSDDVLAPTELFTHIHGRQDTGSTVETLAPISLSDDHPEYGERQEAIGQDIKPGDTVPVVMAFSVAHSDLQVIIAYQNSLSEVIAENYVAQYCLRPGLTAGMHFGRF